MRYWKLVPAWTTARRLLFWFCGGPSKCNKDGFNELTPLLQQLDATRLINWIGTITRPEPLTWRWDGAVRVGKVESACAAPSVPFCSGVPVLPVFYPQRLQQNTPTTRRKLTTTLTSTTPRPQLTSACWQPADNSMNALTPLHMAVEHAWTYPKYGFFLFIKVIYSGEMSIMLCLYGSGLF